MYYEVRVEIVARADSGPPSAERRVFLSTTVIRDHTETAAIAISGALMKVIDQFLALFHPALHASAPPDSKCSDCTIDKEPCPTCYAAWWTRRHPHVHEI